MTLSPESEQQFVYGVYEQSLQHSYERSLQKFRVEVVFKVLKETLLPRVFGVHEGLRVHLYHAAAADSGRRGLTQVIGFKHASSKLSHVYDL